MQATISDSRPATITRPLSGSQAPLTDPSVKHAAIARKPQTERISPKALGIVHTAIARATHAAGWSGKSVLILSEEIDPGTEAGRGVAKAKAEAEKRALSALTSWHRYRLVESNKDTITIQTPAQLDPITSSWGGVLYTLNLQTGVCSCPDCGHTDRINRALLSVCPDAAPVLCKHWSIVAIMAAQGEIALGSPEARVETASAPETTQGPAEAATESGDDEEYIEAAQFAADLRADGYPSDIARPQIAKMYSEKIAARIYDLPTTPSAPAFRAWNQLPGFVQLPPELQAELKGVLASAETLTLWERDRFVTKAEAKQLRALLAAA